MVSIHENCNQEVYRLFMTHVSNSLASVIEHSVDHFAHYRIYTNKTVAIKTKFTTVGLES